MGDEQEPMQADGRDSNETGLAGQNDPPSAGRPDMDDNLGQSGGGAYPNPHHGKHGHRFHGGQSSPGYFGNGQLGAMDVGHNDNSVDEED